MGRTFRGSSTRFARRSRSLLPARLPVNVEACILVGLSSCSRQRLNRSQDTKRRVEETRHHSQHARTTHWKYTSHSFTQRMLSTRRSVQRERGKARPHPKASNIYNDDVSSGPRPQAHWYMLTHRAAAMRLPNGPRIALH